MEQKKQHTKTLGQVFLHDNNIIQKILQLSAPKPSSRIIEIGCGKGILSKELPLYSNDVHIIEIDERWLNYVKKLNLKHTTFHLSDVLQFDFNQFKSKSTVIANIPYHITTPIIIHLSKFKPILNDITIMIQKEVATRILAQPNSKNYGLLTLFCQYHFDIKKGFNVSKNCFFPQPNVDSYVIKLIPTKNHFPLKDEPLFFAMTKSLFWGRRKTIYKCLTTSPYINCPKSIKNNPNIKSKLSLRGESQSISDLYLLFDQLKHEMKLKKNSKTKPDFDIN